MIQLRGGGFISLKNYFELSFKECSELLKARNDERIRNFFYNKHLISLKEHLTFIKSLKKDSKKSYFAIYHNDKFLGSINFKHKDKELEFGFYANADIKGLGRLMEQLSIFYAFHVLGAKRLVLEVFEKNSKVINLHKKFGFTLCATFYKNGDKILKMYLENPDFDKNLQAGK